ncbi:MAG: hypothetical protein JJ920_12480 [Roseitalea sp.]|jgi:hypothetical protein|nr:hypothetical protein [Roseitalea sp.]MBO6720574.1 hypothetical protein [Roseitalea sp.]MBO6743721.1 hypothetical protein [Roseitalea sp.]
MTMNTTKRRRFHTVRTLTRATLLATLFVGPLAGFAAAQADEGARKGNGVGFVLYVSLMRP